MIACSGLRALLRRLRRARQVVRGVDQRDVRERLREVADQPLASRVVLLGEQADVVAQREQPFEERRASSTRPIST